MAITASQSDLKRLNQQRHELIACLNMVGPGTITAGDINFPQGIRPVWPAHHIATLGSTGVLKINFTLQFVDQRFCDQFFKLFTLKNLIKIRENTKKKLTF